jgi:CheY-like chemotaxis protein
MTEPTLAGVTVLLVEDDPKSAKLAAIVLRAAGADVHVATDATAAATLVFGGLRPAIVVMDLDLPGVSGLELARVLKSIDATRHIPIIAVTASGRAYDEDHARAAGCDGYLRKPIDPGSFAETIASHLRV